MGVAGCAFAIFWISSLILMEILWGTMAMERQRQRGDEGLLAEVVEVVEVVVDEARTSPNRPRGTTPRAKVVKCSGCSSSPANQVAAGVEASVLRS
jgi:hypothetical protein